MTPGEFIAKWRASELKERSAAQEHFIDLCRLLDEPTPAEADPTGEHYCFERGARKDTGGDGWRWNMNTGRRCRSCLGGRDAICAQHAASRDADLRGPGRRGRVIRLVILRRSFAAFGVDVER